MNKNLLFASALSLCFLNQLAPMYDDPKYGLTKEQIDKLEKIDNETDEKVQELSSSIKKLESDKEKEVVNAIIDDLKEINKLRKIFDLIYSEMKITLKKACELLQTKTIENKDTRYNEIANLYNKVLFLRNKYEEIAKSIPIMKFVNYNQKIEFITHLREEEKDIFEKAITCVQDMKRKIDSIIEEIEG